jgi:hypothetical protein
MPPSLELVSSIALSQRIDRGTVVGWAFLRLMLIYVKEGGSMTEDQVRVLSFTPTEKGADVVLSGDAQRAAALIERFFLTKGFRLEGGTSAAGVYGKGNKVARALIGGWVKREKYEVVVTPQGDSTGVRISSAMSGWSGSAVGRVRENKGRKLLAEELRSYLAAPAGEAPPSP